MPSRVYLLDWWWERIASLMAAVSIDWLGAWFVNECCRGKQFSHKIMTSYDVPLWEKRSFYSALIVFLSSLMSFQGQVFFQVC